MLYDLLKKCVSIFFNLLNRVLGGKLPPFGSACVIVEKEHQFLVVELPGERIVFPGGFMNWSELPNEAAEREGYEETGLQLKAGELVGYYPCVTNSWMAMSNISFVFAAEVVGGELMPNAEGTPRWMSEEELRSHLSSHALGILNDYQKRRFQHNTRSGHLKSTELLPLVS